MVLEIKSSDSPPSCNASDHWPHILKQWQMIVKEPHSKVVKSQ